MKRRDLVKMLEANGYVKERDKGDHTIYSKSGFPKIPLPRHKELNEYTAKAIIKQANLS